MATMEAGRPHEVAVPTERITGRPAILYVASRTRERAWSRERLLTIGPTANVATNLTDVLQQLRDRHFHLCLVDLADDRAALSMVRVIRSQHPDLLVVGIIDAAHPFMAGDAILAGVADLLPWPFDERDVAVLLANANERSGPARIHAPEGALDEELRVSLIAHSPAMRHAADQVQACAGSAKSVLICGEAGSGRETVARAIHRADAVRAGHPFVVVDCGGMTPADLERRLFGRAVDAQADKRAEAIHLGADAALVEARQGSLLLRRVVEAPARVQASLARLLRDREAVIGKRMAEEIDVRVLASVEGDLVEEIADGRLRRDLYDRLAQHRVDVPPLRRRREDIPQLTSYLTRQASARQGRDRTMSRAAIALLAALPWPGNGTTLVALIEAAVSQSAGPVIQLEEILARVSLDSMGVRVEEGLTLRKAREQFEREAISAVLSRHQGRMGEAAKALGLQRTNLYRKVRQLKIPRSLVGPSR
jgi:DNA-binding NtrC family response regulator